MIIPRDAGDGLDIKQSCDEVALKIKRKESEGMETITKLDSKWHSSFMEVVALSDI